MGRASASVTHNESHVLSLLLHYASIRSGRCASVEADDAGECSHTAGAGRGAR